MVPKKTNARKCIKAYYKHRVSPTCFGNSSGHRQGDALQMLHTSVCLKFFNLMTYTYSHHQPECKSEKEIFTVAHIHCTSDYPQVHRKTPGPTLTIVIVTRRDILRGVSGHITVY